MKKILINALLLSKNPAGVQYSIEYFVDALAKTASEECHFTILVSKDYCGAITEKSFFKLRRVCFSSSNRILRILYENFFLPIYFFRRFDLYHSLGYTLPFFFYLRSVVTIHDLIALDFPSLCQNETAVYYNILLPRTIKRAKKIITVSRKVKEDILTRFPKIPESKINVIHHGVHPRFRQITEGDHLALVKKKYNLPNKYFLFVGNLEPKKNLNRIIKAYASLKMLYKIEHTLIIAGKKGWKYSSIFDLVKSHDLTNSVKFVGYVSEDDLPTLYSAATILLFPSIYEGFGLPVLEAMACGCPVIISDRGALPEISGGICLQVDPYEIEDIVNAVLQLQNNPGKRDQMVSAGLIRSKDFTWEKSAAEALRVYHMELNS